MYPEVCCSVLGVQPYLVPSCISTPVSEDHTALVTVLGSRSVNVVQK